MGKKKTRLKTPSVSAMLREPLSKKQMETAWALANEEDSKCLYFVRKVWINKRDGTWGFTDSSGLYPDNRSGMSAATAKAVIAPVLKSIWRADKPYTAAVREKSDGALVRRYKLLDEFGCPSNDGILSAVEGIKEERDGFIRYVLEINGREVSMKIVRLLAERSHKKCLEDGWNCLTDFHHCLLEGESTFMGYDIFV